MSEVRISIGKNFLNKNYVLVVAVVDSGFARDALQAAGDGVAVSFIVHGRGKQLGKKESVFGVPLDLSRDIVFIIVQRDKANEVQDKVFEAVGLKTEGHGLVYQLPITSLSGILSASAHERDESGTPPDTHAKGGSGNATV